MPKGFVYWLAQAAREARDEAGRKQVHIAAEIDRDQSVITNFEKGKTHRELDRILEGYAKDLDISEIALCERALSLWRDRAQDPLAEAEQAADDLADPEVPDHKQQKSA